jgi:hypothetical protein
MSSEYLTAEERRDLLLSVGTHKGLRRLSPIEVADLFRKAIAGGASLNYCAEAARLDGTTWVRRFLRVSDLPPGVRLLVDWGKTDEASIGFTTATEIARLKVPADQEKLARATIAYRLSSAEVRQIVQLKTRSGRTVEEAISDGLKMRPEITVRHVFIGAITNPASRARLSAMVQTERNSILISLLARVFPGLPVTGRLAPDRFTIVGGMEIVGRIRNSDELEDDVNRRLEADLHV